jgi:hypothetical protein
MQVLALIDTPKSRTYTSGTDTFVAIAKSISTLTTEVGWACYRLDTNGNVDWAKKDGVATKEFVFTGVEADVIALTYTE